MHVHIFLPPPGHYRGMHKGTCRTFSGSNEWHMDTAFYYAGTVLYQSREFRSQDRKRELPYIFIQVCRLRHIPLLLLFQARQSSKLWTANLQIIPICRWPVKLHGIEKRHSHQFKENKTRQDKTNIINLKRGNNYSQKQQLWRGDILMKRNNNAHSLKRTSEETDK